MRNFIPVLSLAVTLAIAASAEANVIGPQQSLASLLFDSTTQTDHSLIVGDKIFHNFTYAFSGDMPDASAVNVIPYVDVAGNFGIRLQGGFGDRPGGGISDALLGYTVDVDPLAGMAISDAHLSGDPATTGVGRVSVTETWTPIDAAGLPGDPQAVITSVSPGSKIDPITGLPRADNTFYAAVDFLPNTYGSLLVLKDIKADAGPALVNGLNNVSIADVTVIDQTFSQTSGLPNNGASTPEPMTLSIFGLGAGALLFRRTRK